MVVDRCSVCYPASQRPQIRHGVRLGGGGEQRQRDEGEQDGCCRQEFAGGHGVSFRVARALLPPYLRSRLAHGVISNTSPPLFAPPAVVVPYKFPALSMVRPDTGYTRSAPPVN